MNPKSVDKLNVSLKGLKQKVRHNDTVPINRLPVELFCMLLERCDRRGLFAYESVCEKWAYFVKMFVHQNLVIARQNKVQPRH